MCYLQQNSFSKQHIPWRRCAHGGCALTRSSYAALDEFLYCKHHFSLLFKEKGGYNHLFKVTSMRQNVTAAQEAAPETETEPETAIKAVTKPAEPEADQTQDQ